MQIAEQWNAILARKVFGIMAPLLQRLVEKGELVIIDAAGNRRAFGSPETGHQATVRLHTVDLPLRLFLNPSLTLGEAYMDGTLTIEKGTLRDFLFIATSNLGVLDSGLLERVPMRLGRLSQMLRPIRRAREGQCHASIRSFR